MYRVSYNTNKSPTQSLHSVHTWISWNHNYIIPSLYYNIYIYI